MFEKIFVVTDLGPGDGGKGGIVHALSCKYDASIIIKRGGAQGSHGVRTSHGESFNFSQWGCGTLEGVPTYLSEQMIISPVGLENESDALKRLGIYNPYTLLSCSPDCIVATPYHRIASMLEELLRKDCPRGTIGSGVGQAYRMHKSELGDLTIYASDLATKECFYTKLQKQREYYRGRYATITNADFLGKDQDLAKENLELLQDEDFLNFCSSTFSQVGQKLQLRDLSQIIQGDGIAIVECSHGVLTDAKTGLKPHVSAIRTLPKFTIEMLQEAGYDGQIINYAVHRAYEIRHGAGPMPTYDPDFTAKMLPGSHKDENRWQGIVRAGPLDLNLLKHALDASNETRYDGLCLTWFDQILANNRIWPICTDYQKATTEYFIKKPISSRELFEFVNEKSKEFLNIPLAILSIGSTELEKIYSDK